jgi:nicotinamidase-related amidase
MTPTEAARRARREHSREPWLVVIDMQEIFADRESPWATPGFAKILPAMGKLIAAFGERVVFTRFVAPVESPQGAWQPYYERWRFALSPSNAHLYELVPGLADDSHAVIDRETFGKWDAGLDAAIGNSQEMVLAGVSTDCCVLSTALAAADAGVHVRVVSDACAGVSDEDHERALAAMELYQPMIEITTTSDVLAGVQAE